MYVSGQYSPRLLRTGNLPFSRRFQPHVGEAQRQLTAGGDQERRRDVRQVDPDVGEAAQPDGHGLPLADLRSLPEPGNINAAGALVTADHPQHHAR